MRQINATNAAFHAQTVELNNLRSSVLPSSVIVPHSADVLSNNDSVPFLVPTAPEAVAPAPDGHYSTSQAGPSAPGPSSVPSLGPSIPLGQPQPEESDWEEDLDDEEDEEEKGYFLFSLAQKYGLTWAIKGDTPAAQTELGRRSAVTSFDKMLLTPGAGVDLMSYLNNHLQIPDLDALPENFEEMINQAPRRAKPLLTAGYKPIPMARYTTKVAPMASVLDTNLVPPVASFLPKPVFPGPLTVSRFLTLSALEGITALNVLHLLPRSALPEDRLALSDHIAKIFFAIMKKSAETVSTLVRQVRHTQLAGVARATREELVYQPIMGEKLYTDDKKVGLAAQPPGRGRFTPRGARRGWTGASAQPPSQAGFQPPRDYYNNRPAPNRGRARPAPYGGRAQRRGGRGGRRGRR